MDRLSYKTISATKENSVKEWLIVDAENQIVGRLASKVAMLLRGKHKPSFTPHADCGDYVIVINAEKVKFTGNKSEDKEYVRYSGYPGGQRSFSPNQVMAKKPEFIIEKAVKGMLPKNRLGAELFRNLKVIVGPEHPHEAQKPRLIDLNTINE